MRFGSNGSPRRSSSVYTLRTSDSPRVLSCVYNKADFEIAMKSINTTRHIQYVINPIKPNIRVNFRDRTNNINIGNSVRNGIDSEEFDLGDVYLNTTAIITLDKRNQRQMTYQKKLVDQLMYHTTLGQIEESKFLLEPFVRDIGILIPFEIEDENVQKIMLRAHAIFPGTYLDSYVDPIGTRIGRFCRALNSVE